MPVSRHTHRILVQVLCCLFVVRRLRPRSRLFPYTTLFRSHCADHQQRKQEFGQRNDQGNNSDEFVIVSAQQQQRQRPHGREEDQHGKQVSAVQHQCTIPTTAFPPNGQKKMTAITTSAPTTTHTA